MNSGYIQRLNNKSEISLENPDDVYKRVSIVIINRLSQFQLIRLINSGELTLAYLNMTKQFKDNPSIRRINTFGHLLISM